MRNIILKNKHIANEICDKVDEARDNWMAHI